MEIEPKTAERRVSPQPLELPNRNPPNSAGDTSLISTTRDPVNAPTSAANSESHPFARKDIPSSTSAVASTPEGSAQTSEFASTRLNVYGSEGECEDAKSTTSSHPFSSPNTSEHDDNHGGDSFVGYPDHRKIHKRKRHHQDSGSSSVGVPVVTIMPGNRPPFPLSERQQMALAMQLSAQDQPISDHPSCSPALSSSTAPSTSGGRTRGKLAKVHRRNERGETPLHLAAKRGEFQHCQELLDDGADVNCVDYAGWTPLHEACNQGWYKTAEVLVEHGANVNVCGLDDDTPLHDAALSGHRKLVILLIQRAADPLKSNKQGKRPVDVAEDPEVKRLMLEGPTRTSSPMANYSVRSPRNEENEATTFHDLDKTLMAEDIGLDTSAAISSAESAECTATPPLREEADAPNCATSPFPSEYEIRPSTCDAEGFSLGKATTGDVSGDASNAAYASTESENEQRLVVVEEDASPMEQPLVTCTVTEGSKNDEIPDPPSTTAIPESSSAGSSKSDIGHPVIGMRPKRYTAYMRQRQLEIPTCDYGGSKNSPRLSQSIASSTIRAKRRKSTATGAKAKDVYEFHSSDSDDEAASANRKLRKYTKVSGRGKKTSPTLFLTPIIGGGEQTTIRNESPAEKDGQNITEKISADRKEEDLDSIDAAVGEVASVVTSSNLNIENEPVFSTATPVGSILPFTGVKSPTQFSKDDTQLTDRGDQAERIQQVRGRSSSQSLPTDTASASVKNAPIVQATGTREGNGSRKERLLGFGRRRFGFGCSANSEEMQKERQAHIENVVACIGSGVTATVENVPKVEGPVGEQAQAVKKKVSQESVKQETVNIINQDQISKTHASGADSPTMNEEDDPMGQSALKVPPLKLILSGRSNSEEDSSSHTASNSREAIGRTYVVQSQGNSPSIERRSSAAGDFVDASFGKSEDGRRPVGNNGNGNSASGNGEGLQRVTRSQVRLHGAQLDRSIDETTALHPRKRKLRSAKTMIEPVAASRSLLPVVSPSLAAIAVKNSYEAHQHMKKEIANKWKQEMINGSRFPVTAPVKGYDQFLLNKKTYLLQGVVEKPHHEETTATPLPPELTELRRRQGDERQSMETRHQVERERLIMSCEREAIRDHNRCVRGAPDPALSVMRVLRDAELYNPLQLDKDIPFSVAGSSGQEYVLSGGDVSPRFARAKRQLIGRQRLEAQCLYATQIQEWEMKLKALVIHNSEGQCSPVCNVSQVKIVEDFSLLPCSV